MISQHNLRRVRPKNVLCQVSNRESDGHCSIGSRLARIRHSDSDILPITVDYTLPMLPQPAPKTAVERWPEIQATYRTKSLRTLALEWNVSQETIRKIISICNRSRG